MAWQDKPTPKASAVERNPWSLLADAALSCPSVPTSSMPATQPRFPPEPPPASVPNPASLILADIPSADKMGFQPQPEEGFQLRSEESLQHSSERSDDISRGPQLQPEEFLQHCSEASDEASRGQFSSWGLVSQPDLHDVAEREYYASLQDPSPISAAVSPASHHTEDSGAEELDSFIAKHADDQDSALFDVAQASFSAPSSFRSNDLSASSGVPVLVASELIQHPPLNQFRMPWEFPAMKSIFGLDPNPLPVLPQMPCAPPELRVLSTQGSKEKDSIEREYWLGLLDGRPNFCAVVKWVKDVSYLDRRDQLGVLAVRKLAITMEFLGVRDVPATLLADQKVDLDSLTAAIGCRSPLTIDKRANSLRAFHKWSLGESQVSHLLCEAVAWLYLKSLKKDGAAASKGNDFMSSIRFLRHVLGYQLVSLLNSRRLSGLAEQLRAGANWIRQAIALTVAEAKHLHHLLSCTGLHAYDRATIAFCLIALYGRAQSNDLADVRMIERDFANGGGFLVLYLGQHKTRRAQVRSRQLLPVLVPGVGVSGEEWLPTACSALEAVGVCLAETRGPLLRAPASSEGDKLALRELCSNEITAFLRRMLSPITEASRVQRISSHSLKRTTLSWAAKFGLTEYERSILGRHTSATASTQAIYALDLATAPTARLQHVLKQIAEGKFLPDNPRAQYFPAEVNITRATEEPAPVAPVVLLEDDWPCCPSEVVNEPSIKQEITPAKLEKVSPLEVIEVLSDSSSSSSSDSASSESDGSESVSRVRPAKVPRPSVSWPLDAIRIHVVSKISHRLSFSTEGGLELLECGKIVSAKFKKPSSLTDVKDVCRNCRRRCQED